VTVLTIFQKGFAEADQVGNFVDLVFGVVGDFESIYEPKVRLGVDLQQH
jgi:hypothetical protein